ncbi:MAG: class I SAM-dependent methyltransferase [Candidatus Latescibacteria bacterium]|nr:class I SAM-dependent methyltransferase [Candidatus Latescibacterota bacterium]
MPASPTRLEREAAFHDRAFAERTRSAAGKFYAVTASSKGLYRELILRDCAGREVLEYGCGTGSHAFELAARGARVAGIDISPEGIAQARRRAAAEGLEDRLCLQVMDAEALEFPDQRFDLVCGSGILHHLDLERALAELCRVLKPGGRAVFFEPLGHNPLIALYRRLTPRLRSADEHPLRWGELQLIARHFARARFCFFHLSSLLAVPFRRLPGFGVLLGGLEALDRLLFRVPFLRKQAWIVVVELEGPV